MLRIELVSIMILGPPCNNTNENKIIKKNIIELELRRVKMK